jgi:hypothetical protein
MVVVVGIDVHTGTHCAVPVDEGGRQPGWPVTVRATDAGHRQRLRRAQRTVAEQRVEFAVEDCRQVSGRLERARLTAAATVVHDGSPPSTRATPGPCRVSSAAAHRHRDRNLPSDRRLT